MTPFLKQIAKHYLETADNISRLVFVFPSHRAQVFFRKYLGQAVTESGGEPVIAPKTLSIEEFFGCMSGRTRSDRLTLLLKLYDCYRAICTSKGIACESLDEFVFWGDVILADFDDADKYLINARDLFRNVSDLKDMTDDLSYLSDKQREALAKFMGNFKEEGEFKMRFARLWNILGELYADFNAALDRENLSYSGKLLRELVGKVEAEGSGELFHEAFPDSDKLVFCGLNVLSASESRILRRFRDLGLADFCWDYQSAWIKDPHNKSSLLMEANLRDFPQAMAFEPLPQGGPQIEVVNVPSGIGQTKLLSTLLEDGSIPADERTAIVLPDESLLQPLLNSIPPRVKEVNVTMGYSMACSSFYSLMCDIAQLQLNMRRKADGVCFYHRPFWNIAGNNVIDALLLPQEHEKLEELKKRRLYYIPESAADMLGVVFRPVITDPKATDAFQIKAIQNYQLEILQFIGSRIASDQELKQRFALELDFAMEYIKAVNLISAKELAVLPQTYFGLLDGVLRTKSIPIKGEPLTGLQIMGPLETRALDFEHVFVLSCNEGVFPRANSSASFIPPLLRRGFDLPTYEYQDAVWAYYFYRLIQRPSKLVLTADTRAEGMRSGEQSRYIKQLRYHFTADVKQSVAVSTPALVEMEDHVKKTDEHISIIRNKVLSATSLQTYLSCSMKFYLSYVLGLKADDELSENMDAAIIGRVYHAVMEKLYTVDGGVIGREYLDSVIKDKQMIKDLVESKAKEELGNDLISGRNIVFCTMICKYVLKTLERDKEMMDREKVDSFSILGLEQRYSGKFGDFRFAGIVDRLDSFHPGIARVVDYKTGKVLKEDMEINDSNAASIADLVFGTDNDKRPKIALQFFIYDMLLDQNGVSDGKVLVNSVYSTRNIMKEMPANVYRNHLFRREMEERLLACLKEMTSKEIAFTCTLNSKTCEYCDFKNICGR